MSNSLFLRCKSQILIGILQDRSLKSISSSLNPFLFRFISQKFAHSKKSTLASPISLSKLTLPSSFPSNLILDPKGPSISDSKVKEFPSLTKSLTSLPSSLSPPLNYDSLPARSSSQMHPLHNSKSSYLSTSTSSSLEMQTSSSISEIRKLRRDWKMQGHQVGFIPTMVSDLIGILVQFPSFPTRNFWQRNKIVMSRVFTSPPLLIFCISIYYFHLGMPS